MEERIREVQAAAVAEVRIYRSCDFHLHFDNIQDALVHPSKHTIDGKSCLLVEFADLLIA